MNKIGVLLINLGTPDHCDRASVYRYLKEFLSDPRVIDLPDVLRWPLVNLIITPLRSGKSALLYKKIWTESGSPLLFYSQQLAQSLSLALGDDYCVALGMRYGNPSIHAALDQLTNCERIIVLPLFPQYSSAATGSALEKSLNEISLRWNVPEIMVKSDFYQDPGYVAAYAELIKQGIDNKNIDMLLFSYHGLPERHITKSECTAACDHINACPAMNEKNRFCYRAQCYATSKAIAEVLKLPVQKYLVAFQSRLGKTPWVKPYTDMVLPELINKGIQNIAVVSPSFVADCLETLEEINIRLREQWQALGGKEFIFIPCLNAAPSWVAAVAEMIKR